MVWTAFSKAFVGLAVLGHLSTAYADDYHPIDAPADSVDSLDDEPRFVQCYSEPLSPGIVDDARDFYMNASTMGSNAAQKDIKRITVKTIAVNFHDMGNSADDKLTASIHKQFKLLRDTYKEYGFNFELNEILHYNNPSWSQCSVQGDFAPKHPPCKSVTRALRKGTYQTLNVFIHRGLLVKIAGLPIKALVLGEATTPLDVHTKRLSHAEALALEGVRIRDITLVDRHPKLFGKTLVHEVGHWLGLLHPFDTTKKCIDNDGIHDTPRTNYNREDCPVGMKPTCGHTDPIHNHMMYTSDPCRTEFTKGQTALMHKAWTMIRAKVKGSTEPAPKSLLSL